MRIKSNEIVFAHHLASESITDKNVKSKKSDQIIILPTDDSRLRIVIIPITEISKVEKS